MSARAPRQASPRQCLGPAQPSTPQGTPGRNGSGRVPRAFHTIAPHTMGGGCSQGGSGPRGTRSTALSLKKNVHACHFCAAQTVQVTTFRDISRDSPWNSTNPRGFPWIPWISMQSMVSLGFHEIA
eukprot:gene15072-biopygen3643